MANPKVEWTLVGESTKLAPLWMRLWLTLRGTWKFWIKPWDRRDHEEFEVLRSPLLAWKIAWDIRKDQEIPDGRKHVDRPECEICGTTTGTIYECQCCGIMFGECCWSGDSRLCAACDAAGCQPED